MEGHGGQKEMTEQRPQDEQLLIDYLLGRCDPVQAQAIQRRLDDDEEFLRLHQDVRNTLAAMGRLAELAPPPGLADRTIDRVRQVRATEALITRAELSRPMVFRSRLSLRDLIAVASVVFLVGIAYFFTSGRFQAQALRDRRLCEAQMGQIGRAAYAYAEENGGFLPLSSDAPRPWLALAGQPAVSNSAALFKLVSARYVPAEVFQCPAVGGGKLASFAVQAGMTDFPQGKFIGYSYQHALGRGLSLNNPALQTTMHDMAILADSNPLFSGGRFQPQRLDDPLSENHGRKGQNVLYLDNHVNWTVTAAAGVRGNNIFLIDGVFNYRGDEAPVEPTDTFLLPTYLQR
jgi:hypothetical protein